jgi:hypothetical protein
MSSTTQTVNTGQQATFNTDLTRVFLGRNRSLNEVYVNNSSYNPIQLKAGTVMGRITATDILVPASATATDGSQLPVGFLAEDLTIPQGTTLQTSLIVQGDVNENAVVFFKGDTLDTVVSGRRYKDHIQAQGVLLVASNEMSDFDN